MPPKSSRRALRELLQTFVSGRDRSKSHVAKIEELLIREFRGSDLFEELTGPVAAYSPSGGEFLYDEMGLTQVFKEVLATQLGE